MLYNDKFVSNFELTAEASRYAENRLAHEYAHWAFKSQIRMKYRITLCLVTVYFEDAEDMVAFKLKFGV